MNRGSLRNVLAVVCTPLSLLLFATSAAVPQGAAPTAGPAPEYTLHAYTNLVQVPVLVLSANHGRLPRLIPQNQFALSIDSGPWFRASHVRLEGDDPISLSIVLDTRGDASELMPRIEQVLPTLSPAALHPNDSVTIYGLDCALVRTVQNTAATPDALSRNVTEALRPWRLRKAEHTRCGHGIHLQEALMYAISQMQGLPGRRVVLVVSDGEEAHSKPSWRDVGELAQLNATTLFAIIPSNVVSEIRSVRRVSVDRENDLYMVSELSGGTAFQNSSYEVSKQLVDFIRMLRERYILDFRRPANSTPGRHSLDVRIDKSPAFVRAAGVTVPIPDPAILADPHTVPSDPSLTPVQGNRRTLPR